MKVLLLLTVFVIGFMVSPAFAEESTIEAVLGSGSHGCEETLNGCYTPMTLIVNVGDTVIFANSDISAHTFTAGNSDDGPSGEFDTGLLMQGNNFKYSAEEAGIISYFCMVHPWMDGMIIIEDDIFSESFFAEFETVQVTPIDDVSELKKEIVSLKLENRELKQKVTSLNEEIEQLEDIIVNALKEIYSWMPLN